MKKLVVMVLTLIVVAMVFNACISVGNFTGGGRMVDGTYNLSGPVRKIDISGVPGTVNISNVKSDVVSYKIPSNFEDLLDINLKDGVLTIGVKNNRIVSFTNSNIEFNIGTDVLEEVGATSAVRFNGDGTFKADTFTVRSSGVISGNLDLDAKEVIVNVTGAGSITLTGKTDSLEIRSSGAATIAARDLVAKEADVRVAGAGTVRVYADENLSVNITGAGSVRYWGDPHVRQSITGAGSIRKGD